MKTKKIMISGLAFDTYWKTPFFTIGWGDEWDMKRLAEEAQKGWIVTKMDGVHYILEQLTPEESQFVIDYKDQPDEEYFELFAAAGWTLVSSVSYIHLFKADLGVLAPHTDVDTKIEKMMHEMRRFGLYTIGAFIVLFALTQIVNQLAEATTPSILLPFAIGMLVISLIAAVFTLLPFVGYWRRVAKLKKTKI
jgi:hypothetical protein